MTKAKKVWLGVATIWPICWIFIFIASIFTFAFTFSSRAIEHGVGAADIFFPVIIVVHLLTVLGTLGLIVYYIFNIFKNPRLEQNTRLMWTILLFFAGTLAMPVYWYLYIWRDAPPGAVLSGPPGPGVYLNQGQPDNWTSSATGYQREQREREGQYVPPPEPPNWR